MEKQTPTRSQSVLILDSDYDLTCILSSFLSFQKIKVAQSKRAREALFKMRNQRFDIVIIDPAMTDGHQFFSGLAEFTQLKHKPELVIMTHNLSYGLPKSLPLPLKSVLEKPFVLDLFWKAIA